MAREIELKLEVPPAAIRKLGDGLERLADGPVKRERQVSVYFDTRSRALRDAGLSLRVRRKNGHYVQTVKSGKDATDRLEWERALSGPAPDRQLARHTALKPFTGKKTWRQLRPVFETDVTRASFPVRSGKSRIEVALDQGRVKAGKHKLSLSEVELELKAGEIADLNRLVSRFAGQAALGLASKAERGYALADGKNGCHVKAPSIVLGKDMTAADGLRVIGFSCLHHLAANREAVLKGDLEGVHQMRVGLRRLRSALSLFKQLVEGPDLEKIKESLKWMSGELADARNFDVLVRETLVPMEEKPPTGLDILERDAKARRDRGLARAQKLVSGPRYRRIVLDTGLWLTGGHWAVSDDDMKKDLRARDLSDTAREILSERTAKVARKVKKVDRLDDRKRHKLRIAVKKLRYAAGFFESLFGASAQKRFEARLKKLQAALGRLNDFRTHAQFARKAMRGRTQTKAGTYALGVVRGEEQKDARYCIKAAGKAGSRLRKEPRYWA